MNMVNRKSSGSSAVELVVGILVLVPVLFLFLDVGVCVLGVMTNDNICREAARAGAAGRPADYTGSTSGSQTVQFLEDSRERAQSVLTHLKTGGYVGQPTLVPGGNFTGPQNAVAPPSRGGGAWAGSYRVTTEVKVTLPASVARILPADYTFRAQHEFPMTKVEPPQYF